MFEITDSGGVHDVVPVVVPNPRGHAEVRAPVPDLPQRPAKDARGVEASAQWSQAPAAAVGRGAGGVAEVELEEGI